jgi:hypothetical protein
MVQDALAQSKTLLSKISNAKRADRVVQEVEHLLWVQTPVPKINLKNNL